VKVVAPAPVIPGIVQLENEVDEITFRLQISKPLSFDDASVQSTFMLDEDAEAPVKFVGAVMFTGA
jgi:hypothetical protein